MRKLIVLLMFTMFGGVAAAQGADRGAALGSESAATEPGPANSWCYDMYAACTADCADMVGNAKGACLRACRHDLEECLGN